MEPSPASSGAATRWAEGRVAESRRLSAAGNIGVGRGGESESPRIEVDLREPPGGTMPRLTDVARRARGGTLGGGTVGFARRKAMVGARSVDRVSRSHGS